MKKLLLFLLILLTYTISFAADSYNSWWQAANKFYAQKEYDSAAAYYEKIAAQNPNDATVYYNLGNTYYRLNLVGPAVLNYERALKINPDNKEAQDNLYLTQNRISNRILSEPDIFFVRWWKSCTASGKANTWAVISLIFFLAFIAFILANRLRRANIPVQVNAGLFVVFLLCLLIAYSAANNKAGHNHAVVMQNDAPFMAAPQNGKAQSLVPEGTKVYVEGENAQWLQVKLPDGRTGWIEKALLAKI